MAACAVLLASACQIPAAQPDTAEDPTETLQQIFETGSEFSTRVLDTADVLEILATRPEFRPDSAAIMEFYTKREMRYAWFVNGWMGSAAGNFIHLLEAGDSLLVSDRSSEDLRMAVARILDPTDTIVLSADSVRWLELSLTGTFFRFAGRKYGGLFQGDPRDLAWFIPRRKKDFGRLLDSLVAGRTDLSPIEPIHPQYRRLKQALRTLHAVRWLDTLPPIRLEDRRKLEPGDRHAIVPDLRKRLMAWGDLPADSTASALNDQLDSTTVAALIRFQQRHGLAPDGIVGHGVLTQLNVPVEQRIRTVLLNMERLRWVPEQQASELLLVNIPEFRMHVYSGDTLSFSMDVVVGAVATNTVVFSDSLSRIVFSPTWTIPQSIVRNEIMPALARDPAYLTAKGMSIVGGSKERPIIVQRPGPKNALGLVKFLFPNSYSIYFHDTPSKGAFTREQRALSHGCIRLAEPRRLALHLLKDDPKWPQDAIDKAMRSGKETGVTLANKVPVLIGYFTAWVDTQGRLNFRDDLYRHDSRLQEELFGTIVPPA